MTRFGRIFLVGAALAFAGVAQAGTQDFTLTNATGYQIDRIYVSPTAEASWQEDVMGSDALADGEGVEISFDAPDGQCMWDLKAVYNDGEEAVWIGFNLCTISSITLHYDNGTTSATYE